MARKFTSSYNPEEIGVFVVYTGATTKLAGYAGTITSGDELFIPAKDWHNVSSGLFTVQDVGPAIKEAAFGLASPLHRKVDVPLLGDPGADGEWSEDGDNLYWYSETAGEWRYVAGTAIPSS